MDFSNYDDNGYGRHSGLPDDVSPDRHFNGNRRGTPRPVYSNRTTPRDSHYGEGYRTDCKYRDKQPQNRRGQYSDEHRYESKSNRSIMNVDIDHEAERNKLHREYIKKHGFAPNSVAAFALTHPESVEYIKSAESGDILVRIKEWNGRRGYTCMVKDAADRFVIGFDATIRLIKDWETMRVEITRTFPDTPIHWLDIYDHMIELRRQYKESHGYESNTVAAMVDSDPDRVTEFTNENGLDCYKITFYNGKEFVCAKERAAIKQVRGYDSLFDELGEYVKNRENDLREKRADAIANIRENAVNALNGDGVDRNDRDFKDSDEELM